MINKSFSSLLLTILLTVLPCSWVQAHFGMLISQSNTVSQDTRTMKLTLAFAHPFSGIGMDMEKPARFFVDKGGKQVDLTDGLQPVQVMGHQGWQADYRFRRPGVYVFAVEPKPYWEPSENLYIKHYSKTIVAAFGADQGWSHPIGLKTEIVPLLRPFGNYSGNTVVGQVFFNGKPVPHAEVEVEFYNKGRFTAPTPYHETQIVLADGQGVFCFSCPQAGWWGFAALREADFQLKGPDGKDKAVELGAVLWLYMDSWQSIP